MDDEVDEFIYSCTFLIFMDLLFNALSTKNNRREGVHYSVIVFFW